MANNNNKKNITNVLSRLTFAPEQRSSETIKPVVEGRFRYFFSIFKAKNSYLMASNLFFLIFMLPLLIVAIIPSIFGGMENLSNMLFEKGTTYFMGNIGFGISDSTSVVSANVDILKVYQLYFLAIACCIPIMAIGLGGIFHIGLKFIWQDKFISKKDSYGNDVPRIGKEFFIGVKKNILQMLIVSFVLAIIFAGVSNAFIYFLQKNIQNALGGGEWVLIIFASIVALITILMSIFIYPMIPMYELPLKDKLKNSFLLMVSMFLPTLFIAIISVIPFLLLSLLSGILKVLIAAGFIVYGGIFYSLLWSNFVQYNAEKIITPIYESQKNKGKKSKKKNK